MRFTNKKRKVNKIQTEEGEPIIIQCKQPKQTTLKGKQQTKTNKMQFPNKQNGMQTKLTNNKEPNNSKQEQTTKLQTTLTGKQMQTKSKQEPSGVQLALKVRSSTT